MRRRTKIVATVGPASERAAVLRGMVRAGMDAARLSLAHGPLEETLERLALIRRVAAEEGVLVGVLADLPGPKVRAAEFPEGGVALADGSQVELAPAEAGDGSTAERIAVDHDELLQDVRVGDRLSLGDGLIQLEVHEVATDRALATVTTGGWAQGRPGVAFPAGRLAMRSPTPDDLRLLDALCEAGVDAVAISFVRSADDVLRARAAAGRGPEGAPLGPPAHLGGEGAGADAAAPVGRSAGGGTRTDGPMIVAKIETQEAVDDIDAIIAVADGVMVARGDLGIRCALEDVPHHQKHIIRTGVAYGRPVITATQMLESMVRSPVPTRAEVSDVANAVFDGTSAVMLSGETAVGEDPVRVVATMARVTRRAEEEFDYAGWGRSLGRQQTAEAHGGTAPQRITAAVSAAAWRAAHDADVAAIIACTNTGATARAISRFRPTVPVVAATPSAATARQLSMAWGITPIITERHGTTDDIVWFAVKAAAEQGFVRTGDLAAVLVGSPTDPDPATDTVRLVRVH